MSNSAITGPIFTDVRRSPSGSAAAPSWSFAESTGTGVYLVSAGVLGLSTNGAQRVVVDAAGNVGIGTASPTKKLHIASSGDVIRIDSTNSNTFKLGWANNGTVVGYMGAAGDSPLVVADGSATERMRIDASGNLLVGTTSNSFHTFYKNVADGVQQFEVAKGSGIPTIRIFATNAAADPNYSGTCVQLWRNPSTSRSINAAGTINASGADYAEYMTKAGEFVIAKGDLCGVNAEGKLTNVFSEAVAFVVKSTNPSYVGGDSWGAGFEADSEELEAARQLVDRIAFCGQVPVNVLGATPGQWIIPVEENGAIKGQAVSNPSFEQYQLAVGKVIAVEEDGRARIIVKIA